jgi:hypothetical protein
VSKWKNGRVAKKWQLADIGSSLISDVIHILHFIYGIVPVGD